MFPQIFGKYVLEREIAAGGMARVYLATLRGAVGFEKRLVVKQIRPELASDDGFVRRFVEEAKTTVELSHPNIVPVYELGIERGVYYIAMEYCDGLTLADLLRETGPLSPEEGAQLGVEICRALDYARRRVGIVHRDVTPRNVLIDEEGAVRLIDFGIAAPAATSETQAEDEVFGSPGHMPPEQLAGRELSPSADVFAVGVLLIEAWTGRPPFRRATAEESAKALEQAPPPIEEADARLLPLSNTIARAIALEPRERLEHAELLSRPLREFLLGSDASDILRRLGARVQRGRRRSERSEAWQIGEGLAVDGAQTTRPLADAASSTAEIAEQASRTFALNTELEAWTRKIPHASDSSRAQPKIEAPERGSPPASTPERGSEKFPSRMRQRLALSGAVLGAVLWFALRQHSESSVRAATSRPPPPVAIVSTGRARDQVPPPPAQVPAPQNAASSAARAKALSSTTALNSAHNTARDAARAERENGTLRLTADPRASVQIQGSGFSHHAPTPVRALNVPAGDYRVTFTSDTYGAPLSTRVTVRNGSLHSLHADFREAQPKLRVQ